MTTALADKTCTPCRGGIPPLERAEAEALRANSRDWELLDGGHRIERKFQFANFREALNFVEGVGELAEAERHHPEICFG
jgi:4a-hydroxytetrahydrobiopterin dehydratase